MIDLRPAQGPRLALQLSPRDEGLSVRVIESPVGEAAADIILQPIDEVLRMVSQPTFHEDVGRGLFRSLLPGPLGELYRAAFAQASLAGQRLTIELRFDRELVRAARYPWELLHDGTRFLLQAGAVNLVRYLTFPEPPRPLTPRSPLEILVVAARPKDQPPLASEFEELQKAFEPLIAEDRLDLAYLLPPTWDALMDWVLAGAPGVLHFEGHGAFTRTGLLIFENPDGQSDPVDAVTVGHAFYSTDLRLAVLSACDTAKAAGESLLASVAPALILAGIPAVVAMQQSLPDDAAVRFSRGFYHALLAGQDLESAVMAGRKQLIRSTFWYVPTLYLRASKAPEIRQAVLERRIDTAGPRSAPVNLPLRFGLWIRRPDSPAPSDDELRRLLGLERGEAVSREMTRAAMVFPVEIGQIRPGTVEVRISAPGCELHTGAIKTLTVFADFDTPPLWYPMTPRQVGRLDVTFELMQGGAVIASVAHTVQITEGVESQPIASVKSHGGEPPAPVPVATAAEGDIRELERDQPRRRESDERQPQAQPAPTDTSELEPLDGVTDSLQSGEPPESEDEPAESLPPGTETAEKELVDGLFGDEASFGDLDFDDILAPPAPPVPAAAPKPQPSPRPTQEVPAAPVTPAAPVAPAAPLYPPQGMVGHPAAPERRELWEPPDSARMKHALSPLIVVIIVVLVMVIAVLIWQFAV